MEHKYISAAILACPATPSAPFHCGATPLAWLNRHLINPRQISSRAKTVLFVTHTSFPRPVRPSKFQSRGKELIKLYKKDEERTS